MSKFNPYFFLAKSDHPVAKVVRTAYKGVQSATLPAPPKGFAKPISAAVQALHASYDLPMRLFVTEPLFKAQCKEVGRGVRCDRFIHHIVGQGDIYIGDHAIMDGRIDIKFGARFSRTPTLRIGSHTGIGNECAFLIGKSITIGDHCRIASEVSMFDSSGHPLDPADRLAGLPPRDEDVRPITVGNNVWIGRAAVIFPGVTIGDGAVVSARAVVMHDVPANTVVAGNPARQVSTTTAAAPVAKPTAPTVVAEPAVADEPAAVPAPKLVAVPDPEPAVEQAPANGNVTNEADASDDTGAEIATIVKLVSKVGDVKVGAEQDFYDAGFSSVRALQLLLELEDAFNTPIPDEAFVGARTAVAIHEMLQQLSA